MLNSCLKFQELHSNLCTKHKTHQLGNSNWDPNFCTFLKLHRLILLSLHVFHNLLLKHLALCSPAICCPKTTSICSGGYISRPLQPTMKTTKSWQANIRRRSPADQKRTKRKPIGKQKCYTRTKFGPKDFVFTPVFWSRAVAS